MLFVINAAQDSVPGVAWLVLEKELGAKTRLPLQGDAEVIVPGAAGVEPGLDGAEFPAAILGRLEFSIALEAWITLALLYAAGMKVVAVVIRLPKYN